jgi:hypothetical protein
MMPRNTSLVMLRILGWVVFWVSAVQSAVGDQEIRVTLLGERTEFVEWWYVCGAFELGGSDELKAKWARAAVTVPDGSQFFNERFRTKEGVVGWWERRIEDQDMPSQDPQTKQLRIMKTRIVNFLECFGESNRKSAYALCFLDSRTTQTRTLCVGSDDGITMWLNGKQIHENVKRRPIVPDEDWVFAGFRQGRNVLLVEVTNADGYWGFMLRILCPGEQLILPPQIGLDFAPK